MNESRGLSLPHSIKNPRGAVLLGAALAVLCGLGFAAGHMGSPIDTVLFGTVFGDLYDPEILGSRTVPAPVKTRIRTFQKRAKAFRSRLPPGKRTAGPERYAHDKRVQLERGIVALIPTRGIEGLARDFALSVPLVYEWEGMSDGPLVEATFAEHYLGTHPGTPLTPYLKIFLAHRYRCAFGTLTLEKKEPAALDAAEKFRAYSASALADLDPLVRFIAEDIENRPFLYLQTGNTPTRVDKEQPAPVTDCPKTALSETIADPWAWSAHCFTLSYGDEASRRESLTDFAMDLNGNGVPEFFIGSKIARGNAGGTYYVFEKQGPVYRYLGALFLHSAAFKVLRVAAGEQPRMARYRRLGAGEGILETIVYDGDSFVVVESEKVFPQGKDRVRLIEIFGNAFQGDVVKEAAKTSRLTEISFTGEVKKAETFERTFGPDLRFRLEPAPLGWMITVREPGRNEDLARLTPPLHFTPNPREVEGWHFRNADNTGPNEAGEKNVNAPGDEREFIFSPEVGRSIQGAGATAAPTEAEIKKVRAYGRGILRIIDYRLNNLEPKQQAGFEWLRFEVTLFYH